VSAERCEKTDLLVDQCGCDIHRPPVNVPFMARYPGYCYTCDKPFVAGDKIRENELGQYAHASHR
jgi:hypothetical protein